MVVARFLRVRHRLLSLVRQSKIKRIRPEYDGYILLDQNATEKHYKTKAVDCLLSVPETVCLELDESARSVAAVLYFEREFVSVPRRRENLVRTCGRGSPIVSSITGVERLRRFRTCCLRLDCGENNQECPQKLDGFHQSFSSISGL